MHYVNFPPNTNFCTWWKTQDFLFSTHRSAFREVGPPQAFSCVRGHRSQRPLPPHLINLSEISQKGPEGGWLILMCAQLREKENNGNRKMLWGPSCLWEKNVLEGKLNLQSLLGPRLLHRLTSLQERLPISAHRPSSSLLLTCLGESPSILL